MRALVILLLVAGTAFGGWHFGSPVWTVYRIGEAAKAGDADRLSAYVDYPALRQSVRTELRARLAARNAGRFEAVRARLAQALTDRAVDAIVSPAMLRLMLSASGSTANLRPPFRVDPGNAALVRDSFDRFSIRADNGGALIFERRGLGWQLAGIVLPPERPAPPAQPTEPALNDATAATIAG